MLPQLAIAIVPRRSLVEPENAEARGKDAIPIYQRPALVEKTHLVIVGATIVRKFVEWQVQG